MKTSAYDERVENPRYERINGEEKLLAQPAIPHLIISRNLTYIIHSYLRGKRCQLLAEPDVFFDDDNRLAPDLAVVCDPQKIKYRGIYGAPDLIIEILSPSTANNDKKSKKAIYEKFGVREYWIVDPKGKSIEVYRLSDNKFVLDHVYEALNDDEWDLLNESEKKAVKMRLKVSLYDDLEIDIRDVFEGV